MLVPILLPKQLWSVEAQTPLDPWRCVVVSGTKMLAPDPLSPVGLPGGAFTGRTCLSSTSCRWLIGLRSGEFWCQMNTSNWFLCSSNRCWTIFTLWQGAICSWKEATGNTFSHVPIVGGHTWLVCSYAAPFKQTVMQHVIWHRSIWTSINFWPLELQ